MATGVIPRAARLADAKPALQALAQAFKDRDAKLADVEAAKVVVRDKQAIVESTEGAIGAAVRNARAALGISALDLAKEAYPNETEPNALRRYMFLEDGVKFDPQAAMRAADWIRSTATA